MRTNIIEMGRLVYATMDKVEKIFNMLGISWDPIILLGGEDTTIQLTEGVTWSPCKGLIIIRDKAPEKLLHEFFRNDIYPTVI